MHTCNVIERLRIVKVINRTRTPIAADVLRRMECDKFSQCQITDAPGIRAALIFTVNLLERSGNYLLVKHIGVLRAAIRAVKHSCPFEVHTWVVLPGHTHCVIELPPGDSEFTMRWRLIKNWFSEFIPPTESRSLVRVRRGERGIWQRPYWGSRIFSPWNTTELSSEVLQFNGQ